MKVLALSAALALVLGCRATETTTTTTTTATTATATTTTAAPPAASAPALTFDPSSLEKGTAVGEWKVRDVRLSRDQEGGWIGEVLFTGEASVRGTFQPHPDGEPLCFFADAAETAQLPRFANDERKPWFCFDNAEDVRKVAKDGMQATIRIADFHYAYAHSDVVNGARFVRIE